jgi:hypothetical protein
VNPAAILALISELYSQVSALSAENATLREALADHGSRAPQGDGHVDEP